MEDMIKKIVDADNEVKAMEERTLKERKELAEKIDNDTKAIYDRYMNNALETIKRNDIQEEKRFEQLWKDAQSKQKSAQIKLRSDFEHNCDKWVDEIVKRTLE